MMSRIIIQTLILCFCVLNSYAWNMQGHQVVAQIAYDNLSPNAKKMCHKYLHPHARRVESQSFIKAAIWPDQIRWRGINWYDKFHYINIPFSTDGTSLPPVESTNAVWAINNAVTLIKSKRTTAADKVFALRILIHVVGDLHQPLHSTSKVSNQLPNGDLGGNLFMLGTNNVGHNLHQYWDNGAGFFRDRKSSYQIKARRLERKWSCLLIDTQFNPEQWARESHSLAINQVYQINFKEIPSNQYQSNAQNLIQKQAAIAGCRLAAVLNEIAKE